MELEAARTIVRYLSQGINPIDRTLFESGSPYNHPDVIRALYTLLERTPHARKSPEEKQQVNLARGMPRNTGLPWTDDARSEIGVLYRSGAALEDLSRKYERSKGAIIAELLRQSAISQEQAEALGGRPKFRPASATR